jgi:hypothetical protein
MSFLRHVGKISDRKVAIVFREVPGESHMCLVVYTEILNAILHDALMQCIESDIGQNSENLADALNRTYTQDGKIILHMLHNEGLMKRVQTSQVIMTPNSHTAIKLEELNKILNEMQQGEAAVKKLADLDKSAGMQSPGDVARRMRNQPAAQNGALDDAALAQQRMDQALKMEHEANGLLVEAKRLKEEAATMYPALSNTESADKPKSSRGRPRKASVGV